MVFCQMSVDEQRQEEPAIANASAAKWQAAKGRFGSSVSKKDAERETEAANVRRKLRVKPDSATAGGKRVFRIFRSASRSKRSVFRLDCVLLYDAARRDAFPFGATLPLLRQRVPSISDLISPPRMRERQCRVQLLADYGAASNAGSFHPLALCLPPRVTFNCKFGQ